MNTLTRKQREVADRHDLFLDIAGNVLETEGFQALSMDRIAELAEYSKGTVYQHFHCKEEVLIQLCNQCMVELETLFQRACLFNGNHRERLMAVFFANDLWAKIEPRRPEMIQTLGADGIKDKVSEASLERHNKLEASLFANVSAIVSGAMDAGDLALDDSLNAVELVFGLWALSYGGQLIQLYDIPLTELGVRDPGAALIRITTAALDGIQWKPLSADFDYQKTLVRVADEIFAEDIRQLSTSTLSRE